MRGGCCEGVWCGNWCGTEVVMAGTVIGEGRECVGGFFVWVAWIGVAIGGLWYALGRWLLVAATTAHLTYLVVI